MKFQNSKIKSKFSDLDFKIRDSKQNVFKITLQNFRIQKLSPDTKFSKTDTRIQDSEQSTILKNYHKNQFGNLSFVNFIYDTKQGIVKFQNNVLLNMYFTFKYFLILDLKTQNSTPF